ncbi:hypothetical protein H0194_09335 [Corynebacterium incognita]|uniref:Uncharacterized protein n=1 Tax=Corynebacterium incognita TaxID=2754725 RepID=A0A7G7CSN9_9CORY|nr:hypothetical protein H0194_09335 [Corynebacterium incognita]
MRSVNSLCTVGSGAGAAIVCALLGISVVGGIACGAVLGLISMFGCSGAKQRVCADTK